MSDNVTEIRIVDDKRSGLATASLVLGIIAIVGCWIPFLNTFSIILGFVGLGLGIPAFIIYLIKKKGSLGKSIAGLVLCVLTLVIAFSITSAAVKSINDTLGSDSASKTVYAYGERAELDGVSIKVLNVQRSKGYTKDYFTVEPTKSSDEFVIIKIEIKNNSDKKASYNEFDFSIQTGKGDIQDGSYTLYDTGNNLNSVLLLSMVQKSGSLFLKSLKAIKNLC